MAHEHTASASAQLHHHLRRMTGRDPAQSHRAATPLELLYDLTLVVAFGTAGNQLAHAVAAGHVAVGIAGFAFAMFAATWAWINFTWFASAYDTDDWFMRLAVLTQMGGVLILALGLPDMFHGLEDGWQIHNEVMVGGYVVMRIAMVGLWLRAAKEDPSRRQTCQTYALGIIAAQIGWVAIVFLHLSTPWALAVMITLLVSEMLLPYLAEAKHSSTPWHPHHIAERYSLLTIIALGEGIIGTTSALEALIAGQGWSVQAAVVLAAGLSLTFGCWWIYFNIPFGELLVKNRDRSFIFGYGHLLLYAAITAIGAGLHVAAYAFQGETHLAHAGVLLSVAIPVGIYIFSAYALTPLVKMKKLTSFHLSLLVTTALLLTFAVVLNAMGLGLGWSLLIMMLAPWITVIGHEMTEHTNLTE